jgi:phosphoenolpyruvate synthase/pyruvate phosphate dikinase
LHWLKYYHGHFSFLVDFLGLEGYFDTFNKEIGICFNHAFVAYEKGITDCYLTKEDVDSIVSFLLNKVKIDHQIIGSWAARLVQATDILNDHFKEDPVVFLASENFDDLKQSVYLFSVYQFIDKEIANHLDKKLLDIYSEQLQSARKHCEKVFFDLTKLCADILDIVGRKTDYSLELLECLTLKEIEEYIGDGRSLPDKKILEARHNYSGIIYIPEPILLNEKETKAILDSLTNIIDRKEIKGVTGYPGKVRGVCRVIKDFRHAQLNAGEILVTGMTDPNFVSLMEKAAAIITDAGGILCHAAIVSRELKRPCIIGTQIATQILHDGDMVEVDADKGIVRIIK